MPKLNVTSQIVKFALPSTANTENEEDKAWVELETAPSSTADIVLVDPNGTEVEAAIAMLAVRIKDWNFTDETGAKLPITVDTVKHLDLNDFGFLADKIPKPKEGLSVEEKKT